MQPKLSDPCASCHHKFEAHYKRFDGRFGCSYYSDSQRDGGQHCFCPGFAVPWKPDTEVDALGHPFAQQDDR